MSKINSQQMVSLKTVMEIELARLEQETEDELNPDRRVTFADVSGDVADNDDQAVAETIIDLDNAVIGLHLQKVHDLKAALERMQTGEYGLCTDCGEAVRFERLSAYPTAKRCVACQTQHEKSRANMR